MNYIQKNNFQPEDIFLQDDSFHLKGGFGRVETWYYDAIFENNYSMVSLINVAHIGRFGFVLTGLFIYKDSKPIKIIRRRYKLSDFKGNNEKPLIKIKGNEILKGYISDNQDWITHISRDEENVKIDLDFIKNCRGFKGKTYLGKWLVIPKMEVSGSLFIDNNEIRVKGFGYHDHNIYPIYAPLINRGYYFGKLYINPYHLTWARIIKNHSDEQLLAILSINDEYYSIPQKSFNIEILNEKKDHKKLMPYKCYLNINSDIIKLKIDVEPVNYHYIGILAANYWRYHVRYKGEVEIESVKKKIDEFEITEYLKFF